MSADGIIILPALSLDVHPLVAHYSWHLAPLSPSSLNISTSSCRESASSSTYDFSYPYHDLCCLSIYFETLPAVPLRFIIPKLHSINDNNLPAYPFILNSLRDPHCMVQCSCASAFVSMVLISVVLRDFNTLHYAHGTGCGHSWQMWT